jgi:hypothetical protein
MRFSFLRIGGANFGLETYDSSAVFEFEIPTRTLQSDRNFKFTAPEPLNGGRGRRSVRVHTYRTKFRAGTVTPWRER